MTELVTARLEVMVRVIGNAAREVGEGEGGVVEKVIVNPHAWWLVAEENFSMSRSPPLLPPHLLFCSNFHH